jgi:calcium-dependent protein kinase
VLLGQGGYGEVRKCVSRSDKVVRAVKIIKKESITSEEHETFKNEMNILRKLDHPNILKVFEVFEDAR